jgi:DNA-binding response OmpR family regulator
MAMPDVLLPHALSTPPRVLVADPERESRERATAALEARQLEVWTVGAMAEAWKLVERDGLPHAAVVDLGAPAFDGVGLCERMRLIADVPIVAISGVHDTATIVRTLDRHADDFVRKPFAPAELAARVVALLRRVPAFSYTAGAVVRIDPRLAVDFGRRTLVVGDERRRLTPIETKILYLLVREVGRPVESRFLLARLWPTEDAGEETLRAHVYRLRSKLEPGGEPAYISTVRGVGYRFSVPGGGQNEATGDSLGPMDAERASGQDRSR